MLRVFALLLFALEGMAQAVPFPIALGSAPSVNTLLCHPLKDGSRRLQLGLGTQARVMYNLSNLPGPGASDFSNTGTYDFFRQRLRIVVDFRLVDTSARVQVGSFTQVEYRGGWGGSSPTLSDPRGQAPLINPFNRLQPRGVRYGFLYADWKDRAVLSAGLLPLTDVFGGLLFDADWGFSVGGVALGGPLLEKGRYRLAYVRLVDGVGGTTLEVAKTNGNLLLAEQSYPLRGAARLGFGLYHLVLPSELQLFTGRETWAGLVWTSSSSRLSWKGSLLLNHGELDGEKHTGFAGGLRLGLSAGRTQWSFLAMASTGSGEGETNRAFLTPHALLGTAAYWALTHLFTPAGPSDVNDLALEPGNQGAGLLTTQVGCDFPLHSRLSANLFGGWFHAVEERNGSHDMGLEFGGLCKWKIAESLQMELGAAYAPLGEFFGTDPDPLFEAFSRLQFEW